MLKGQQCRQCQLLHFRRIAFILPWSKMTLSANNTPQTCGAPRGETTWDFVLWCREKEHGEWAFVMEELWLCREIKHHTATNIIAKEQWTCSFSTDSSTADFSLVNGSGSGNLWNTLDKKNIHFCDFFFLTTKYLTGSNNGIHLVLYKWFKLNNAEFYGEATPPTPHPPPFGSTQDPFSFSFSAILEFVYLWQANPSKSEWQCTSSKLLIYQHSTLHFSALYNSSWLAAVRKMKD